MVDEPVAILETIADFIKPLRPPVEQFETSIRTTPFRVLISVLLSSRTKDPVTQRAAEKLFALAESPAEMTRLTEEQIASVIYPVGFFRQKAHHIKEISEKLSRDGKVPDTFDCLTALPGVGRKTANLVLALAFQTPAIAVDIHVFRISRRLAFAVGATPADVEEELKMLFPQSYWNKINRTLVGFGQTICKPQRPLCHRCPVQGLCPYFQGPSQPVKKI